MKSYTDLEQSKKLAEILPLESADMYWYLATKGVSKAMFNEGYNEYGDFELPCWSIAALLDILQYPTLFQRADQKWGCTVWIDATLPYEVSDKDEPIDACYEMIVKLHEQKLL